MSDLITRIEQNIRSRSLFQPGERIVVAVSGGLDSMVLLAGLHALAAKNRWHLGVAHLNHQLRGRDSDADERLVQTRVEALGLPFCVARADVRGYANSHKLSLEMAAREMRHEFLARTATRTRSASIGLAHHADDQLELFFLRLLRGSGSEGLAGMKWQSVSPADSRIRLVRPLLDQSKEDLRAFASETGLLFREDASNALLDFQRNRIRHELLPLLKEKYQPALEGTILRLMSILEAEGECIGEMAEEWLAENRAETVTGKRRNRPPRESATGLFSGLSIAVQRRCLQRQLLQRGIVADFDLVERLRLVPNKAVSVRPASGAAPGQAGAQQAKKHFFATRTPKGQVLVSESGTPHLGFQAGALELVLGQPRGQAIFDGLKITWRFVESRTPKPPEPAKGREVFDAAAVGHRVVLRHWRPGDRFQPIGLERPAKLQDLFTNKKVSAPVRRRLVVGVGAGQQLFWVEGLRISEGFKVTQSTKQCLMWRWERA